MIQHMVLCCVVAALVMCGCSLEGRVWAGRRRLALAKIGARGACCHVSRRHVSCNSCAGSFPFVVFGVGGNALVLLPQVCRLNRRLLRSEIPGLHNNRQHRSQTKILNVPIQSIRSLNPKHCKFSSIKLAGLQEIIETPLVMDNLTGGSPWPTLLQTQD